MGTYKTPSEGGSGGRRGHSNMEHWIETGELKDAARIRRRQNDKSSVEEGLEENETGLSILIAILSMSLDGFVADRNDGVAEVFDWYFNSGDIEFDTGGSDPMTFSVSRPSAEHIRGLWSELGAVLTGRRTFDVAHGWGGNHAWGPAFILTHDVPAGWPRPNSTVHFVTDGLESAVNQAKAAAGKKSVGVHGADTIQQCLNAGLLDEIHVDIAAVLLGSGVRLFDRLARAPIVLGNPRVIAGVGVTHVRYPCRAA